MAVTHSPVYNDLAAAPRPLSAVSWPAIFAGAAGAAALSLILLVLGTGLGLSSVSPWVQQGVSATTFGVSTVLWITFTQLVASGLGGYLAGRLRTRWSDTIADEVYFRDTAHGFLAWAVASLATAALLTSVIASIVGGGVQAGATVAAGGAVAAGGVASQAVDKATSDDKDDLSYFIHALFRGNTSTPAASSGTSSTPPAEASTPSSADPAAAAGAMPVPAPAVSATPLLAPAPSPEASAAEATAIFANGLKKGALPADDATYLAQQVAARTGMSVADAQKRVTESFGRVQIEAREAEATARETADKARSASAKGALWLFISLLAGAFVASLAATFGGRQRDTV